MKLQRNLFSHLFNINSKLKYETRFKVTNFKNYSTVDFDFPERAVKIRTCGNLYKQWKEQKVFWNLPAGDLTFNVRYIDTSPIYSEHSANTLPTVLVLHGAPGSWRDFASLSTYLHRQRFRVIAPSFPDFSIYKPGIFRHSDFEKAQYIKDFLTAVSVSHVDFLICHSSSVYPGLILCLYNKLKMKSLVLLNPGTFNLKTMSATKHFIWLQIFAKACENPIALKFMEVVAPSFIKKTVKIPLRFESMYEPLLSATTMVYAHVPESKEKFQQVVLQKLPILFIFSENDPLISTESSHELAELIGAHVSDIFIYDSKGRLVQKGRATSTLKVMAFQQGSHYVFFKHPEIIQEEVADFLKLHM